MPERRRPRLRRAAYLTAVGTTCAAFALSLAGIANTQGQVKSNGEAAALARKLERQTAHERCHRPAPATQQPVTQQREV
jgi:hypothetical protein